jgi:uncharacterized cupin superfamily protein
VAAVPGIVSFRQSSAEPQPANPDASRLVSGNPRLTAWNYYSDPSQQFFAGIWAATRGCWRIQYTEHEFCHLLEGRVVLTSSMGERWEFGVGDSFVVPAGFAGTWEVLEDCRKLYAIFESSAK